MLRRLLVQPRKDFESEAGANAPNGMFNRGIPALSSMLLTIRTGIIRLGYFSTVRSRPDRSIVTDATAFLLHPGARSAAPSRPSWRQIRRTRCLRKPAALAEAKQLLVARRLPTTARAGILAPIGSSTCCLHPDCSNPVKNRSRWRHGPVVPDAHAAWRGCDGAGIARQWSR
jgi:hypothetical protein